MAEKTLIQKVEDELTTCSICLDTYANPKLLQCFHVYCQGCLTRLVFRDQQGQLVLNCPSCRQITLIPAGGVAGLQSAFHINHLLGIMEEHKKGKDESTSAENSTAGYFSCDKVTLWCSEHTDEELKLYCNTCGRLICLKCVIKGSKHQNHDYELLDDAFKKYKEEINLSLKPMEKQMATIGQAFEQLDACSVKITDQQATIEAHIHSTIGRLQDILTARKAQLIDQLHRITQSKLKSLAAQKDQLETIQVQLRSCLHFMKKSMKANIHCDVLRARANVIKQVKELITPIQPNFLKSCTEADLMYSGSADTLEDCRNYGQLSGPSFEDLSKCCATGNGLEVANVGEKSIAILHAVNCKGEPCIQPISLLECELISEIAGTRVLGRVERIEQSKYEISYQPTIKGRHHLHIKVKGQHIRGSPFSVAVKSSIQKLGPPIRCIEGVNEPYGVALNHKQELVISGNRYDCIHVFSPNSKKLLSFGSHGSSPGKFKYPMGVAVNKDGNVLVADSYNHRVQKFTAEGQFLKTVGTKGKKNLQFDSPTDITFNTSNNKVYITDTLNHRVQALNSDLTFFSSIGNRGSGKEQFILPCGIACDNTGKIYIADSGNHRIQVFTATGEFLRTFGRRDGSGGELYCPMGLAIDGSGMIYVSENYSNRVSVFTPEGRFVKAFGGRGSEEGQFESPRGLAVDNNGVVYVCDMKNNRIQIF